MIQPTTAAGVLAAVATSLVSTLAHGDPHHLRVIWHENPATEAVVSWSTEGPSDTHIVWDDEPHSAVEDYEYSAHPQRSGQYDEDDATVFHHHTLRDLSPADDVHFRIKDDDHLSESYWFRTAPADSRPFVLLYGGDSRSDSATRRMMNQQMRDLLETQPTIIALHHGGDYVEWGRSWNQWDQWLRDWQETITADGRMLPIIPARGNHEGNGVLYNRVFGFPGDHRAEGDWWTTRIGEDFTLIVLDSNVSQAGAQRRWLQEELAEAQKYRWIVPSYHRPAYPAVKTPGGALYHWVPLFEQYNVDFALESDGHVLKRTVPIREGQPDPTGVVYLGEGGLGVPQRTPQMDRWYLKEPGMAAAAHHLQAFRVTPDAIYYSAILEDGSVADTYEFSPRRRGQYLEPSVSNARFVSENTFEVQYDRLMRANAATNKANYTFKPRLKIVDISYDRDERTATIHTEALQDAGYRLTVDGVVDDAGKPVAKTAFLFKDVSGAEGPVTGELATPQATRMSEKIETLPVGEKPTPQDPPFITCEQSGSRSGGGLVVFFGFALLVWLRRPERSQR